MRINHALLTLLLAAGTMACQDNQPGYDSGVSAAETTPESEAAAPTTEVLALTAQLENAEGESVGTATFSESPGGVLVRAEFTNLPPGLSRAPHP